MYDYLYFETLFSDIHTCKKKGYLYLPHSLFGLYVDEYSKDEYIKLAST